MYTCVRYMLIYLLAVVFAITTSCDHFSYVWPISDGTIFVVYVPTIAVLAYKIRNVREAFGMKVILAFASQHFALTVLRTR